MKHFNIGCRAAKWSKQGALISAVLLSGMAAVWADEHGASVRADAHAPIGVMGDHMHKKGEWMVSYRFMRMYMQGNRIGDDSVSPLSIATTVPNRFFGLPGQPPTLRVVPVQMDTNMHMFGLMYAPSDWLTLMFMGNYIEKSMDHITFQGGMGGNVLGDFTTRSSGAGDSSVTGLLRLYEQDGQHVHANIGLSLPTGGIKNSDQILTPTGATPSPRLPYPMQLGSGSYDPIIGLTYTGTGTAWAWGAQWRSVLRVENNSQSYRLGDEHRLTTWLSRLLNNNVSLSVRLQGMDRGNISGIDPLIVAPVQTADPLNQGLQRLDLGLGVNLAGDGALSGHRLALEINIPLYQDLNGPQLESDWMLTTGYQYAF